MTSVIRVKRKRDCEPAEALLLARKKWKGDQDTSTPSLRLADVIGFDEKVFHYAATVESGIAHSEDVVADKVKEAMQVREERKKLMREGLKKRKLPMPCSKLPKLKQLKDATITACQTVFQDKCLKLSSDKKLDVKRAKSPDASGIGNCGTCVTYHNDDHVPKMYRERAAPDEILCNDTKMVRERVDPPASSAKDSDFVYDLYYCRNVNWDLSELLRVQPYAYSESELFDFSESEEEYYEDDDDSNDESNWRNDYPDDETTDTSSDSDSTDREIAQEEDEEEEDDDLGNQDNNDDLCQFGMEEMAALNINEDIEVEAYLDPGAGNDDAGGGDDRY